MDKAYRRINWENYPSDQTPINESNLNRLDLAADILDDRTISLDATKLDKATANGMVKEVTFDPGNGIFTVTYLSGATVLLDTNLEKLAVNFAYDAETERLVIALDDGTKQYVDLSSLITEYEFEDTDTIAFQVVNGKVRAQIRAGSITEDQLEPDYLSDVQLAAGQAQGAAAEAAASALSASASEQAAKESEINASAKAAEVSVSEESAAASAEAAARSEAVARASEQASTDNEAKASASARNAKDSEVIAVEKAEAASVSEAAAVRSASLAEQNAQTAVDKAILSESYARGGTGTRAGEDTDNAYFYMQEAKAQTGGIPTKLSELTNDMDFVTSMTQALAYYYKSSQLYTKEEIDGMISAIPKFAIVVVDTLPTERISETTIYLLKQRTEGVDTCSEWVHAGGRWEKLGDMALDLSGYLTKTGDGSSLTNTFGTAATLTNIATGEKQGTIFGKVSKAIATLISHISTAATASALGHVKVDNALSSTSANPVQNKTVNSALAGKLATTGDASNTTIAYTEATDLEDLVSGEKQSVAFGKLKLAVKNIIAIGKLIGNTDISSLGNGSLTGAIAAVNNKAGSIKGFNGVFMISSVGNITNCNDLKIGYTGYTYYDTVNSPDTTTWLVFCYGVNDMYRVQIAVHSSGNGLRVRSRGASTWSAWYKAF